jgi:CheY-like chemotaxis protein
VLLIEDNAGNRETLRMLLQLWGHQVEVAEDGRQGLDGLLAARPDVAVVDIGLPGLDGYEVARRVRRSPAGAGIFLIALTGYGQPDDHRRAFEAGFDAFLVKPVDPGTLARLLANCEAEPADAPRPPGP